jgi:hypothetical protein
MSRLDSFRMIQRRAKPPQRADESNVLLQRFAGCALGILALTLRAALLCEVARFHNRRANLAGREPHVDGVPRLVGCQ